jgi:MFS family permease
VSSSQDRRPLRKDLRLMAFDGASFSLMVGAGETFLPAFALALGLGDVVSGLVSTLPLLAGAAMQLSAPRIIARLGSRRRWVVLCASVQALAFVPLIIAALVGAMPALALFAVAAVYWAAGLAAGPAWNTWAEDIVPRTIRARYFARRARLMQFAVLLGLLSGGLLLDAGDERTDRLFAFAGLFLLAAIARGVSAGLLSRQSEVPPAAATLAPLDFRTVRHRLTRGASGRLLVYMLAAQTAVQISGPFFTPYMLSELRFSYIEYMSLLATTYVVRILLSPLIGELAHRVGPRRMLFWAAIGLAPSPIWWVLSDTVEGLLLAQIYSGIVWGAFELCSLLLFFETLHVRERTSVLTLYNMANAAALTVGSLLGAAVMTGFGPSTSTYHGLFIASGVMRLLPVLLLRRVAEARPLPGTPVLRTVAVRANSGSLEQPVLSAMPRRSWMQVLRARARRIREAAESRR